MHSAELREAFSPVVKDIIGLLEGQISQVHQKGGRIKHILLVGGFGESDYILQCLSQHSWGPGGAIGKIEIIRPESA